MNRAERRKQDRKNKQEPNFFDRNSLWYHNLSFDKKEFLRRVILSKIQANDKITAAIMDGCLMAAVDDVVGIETVRVKQIIDVSNEYMLDYKKYIEEKGDRFMMLNDGEKEIIKKRIGSYIAEGMSKATGLKKLKTEFGFPNAELSNLWVEVKNKFDLNTVELILQCNHNTDDKVTEEVLVNDNYEDRIGLSNSSLKIKSIDVEGQCGIYTKFKGKVVTDGIEYDADKVKQHQNDTKQKAIEDRNKINEQIKSLQQDLENLNRAENWHLLKCDEIISILDMPM